jgi:acetolactate synthase-1/3 small subunit
MRARRYVTPIHKIPVFYHSRRNYLVQHTLVALVQDRPGVLNRAASVFRRRSINIDSLTVARTDHEGISRMTWVFTADDAAPVVAQLEKLIDVLEVYELRVLDAPSTQPTVIRACAPSSSLASMQADGVS